MKGFSGLIITKKPTIANRILGHIFFFAGSALISVNFKLLTISTCDHNKATSKVSFFISQNNEITPKYSLFTFPSRTGRIVLASGRIYLIPYPMQAYRCA